MTWSLGLSLYKLGLSAPDDPPPPRAARPPRRLVWLHAPGPEAARAMSSLAQRLGAQAGVVVLITGADGAPMPKGTLCDATPAETPGAVGAFLDHWMPDVAVQAGGELRPLLIREAAERGVPMFLVEGRAPRFPPGRIGWWPGLMRTTLGAFRAILPVDEPAARDFRRAGAAVAQIEAPGRMEHPSAALPCLEAERAALARLLTTRPVWFAALPPEAEEAIVTSAHRGALRLAHRMLLILAPEDPARAAPIAEKMAEVEGWTVARRSLEEEPEDEVQVYLVDASELGLWLRLAPITYLGGSLTAGGARLDPSCPAALGSTIIHGPRAGDYGATVGRLAAAQATALVGSGADLADALGELVAPDRAARYAQAAWAVTSEGAEVTEHVMRLIQDAMPGVP